MNICKKDKQISHNVWEFIEHVKNVGEESITDYLIWQWSELDSKFKYINVEKHSKEKENKISGADFELELWILTPKYNISFVFQAKKLIKTYDAYRSKLDYKNGKKRQIDTLINFAKSEKKLPFYFFYSKSDDKTITKCPTIEINKTALFITDAYSVNNLINTHKRKHLSKNEILKLTMPFHCLFCCPLYIDNIGEYIKPIFPAIRDNIKMKSLDIPPYVSKIATGNIQDLNSFILQNNLYRYRNIGVLDLR